MLNPDFEAVEEHFWMCLCNFVEHSRLGYPNLLCTTPPRIFYT